METKNQIMQIYNSLPAGQLQQFVKQYAWQIATEWESEYAEWAANFERERDNGIMAISKYIMEQAGVSEDTALAVMSVMFKSYSGAIRRITEYRCNLLELEHPRSLGPCYFENFITDVLFAGNFMAESKHFIGISQTDLIGWVE